MLEHEKFMKLAFNEAKRALGETSPNPLVGSIIVKDGRIISTGYHKKAGLPHAELDAILNAKEPLDGATLYVNLEPCCHTNKRTPPCAQRIIAEKIKKVVISNLDPNPFVAGNGVKLLEEAGIEVITGILEDEGKLLNEIFFTHITKKRPFICLKVATTLDSKMATPSFESKWITGEKARNHVHNERQKYDAILVGGNTIRRDNPSLTVRLSDKVVPKKRIIMTKSFDFSMSEKVFTDNFKDQTYLFGPDKNKAHFFYDINDFNLNSLYENGITSLYIEGGSEVLSFFLKNNYFDKIQIYFAPKILGDGISPFKNLGIKNLEEASIFKDPTWEIIGDDALLTAYRRNPCLLDS